MTAPLPHLRRLARLALAAHGLTILRMVVAAAVLFTIDDTRWDGARAVGRWVSWGLGALALGAAIAATAAAAAAGLRRAVGRFGVLAAIWASTSLSAQLGSGLGSRAAAALTIDLALIAWCALLGQASRAATVVGSGWFRTVAYGVMGLHIAIQVLPAPCLDTLGAEWVAAIAIAATVVALGAASADAWAIEQRVDLPPPSQVSALAEAGDRHGPDDPWRPGD